MGSVTARTIWVAFVLACTPSAEGAFWIVNTFANDQPVRKFDPVTGAYLGDFVPGGEIGANRSRSMMFGQDGAVWIFDWDQAIGYRNAARFNPDTQAFLGYAFGRGARWVDYDNSFFNDTAEMHGMAWGVDGRIYAGGAGRLYVYNAATGAYLRDRKYTSTGETWTILAEAGGTVLIANRDSGVFRYDYNAGATGTASTLIAPGTGGLGSPWAMCFGPDGNLYVADGINQTVERYAMSNGAYLGQFVTAGSGGLSRPADISFGPDGFLYLLSNGTNQILRYNGTTGAFDSVFASNVGGDGGRPAYFLYVPEPSLGLLAVLAIACIPRRPCRTRRRE